MGSRVNLHDRGRARSVSTEGDRATVDGQTIQVERLGDGRVRVTDESGSHLAWVTAEGRRVFVTMDGRDYVFETGGPGLRRAQAHEAASGEVAMPMPGLVITDTVKEGDRVQRGQPLIVVEAMKMEHTLRAPKDGTVRRLAAGPDKRFEGGVVLLEVEA
jgi:acetyl/propionyl-CoA carboxylase alpha subunit